MARVMLPRACGCTQEFQHYKVDKYRAERQAKFQSTRCPACVAKLVEEEWKPLPPRKGEILKQLPLGTRVTLSRAADGSWGGTLSADGTTVEVVGAVREAGPGMQAVAVELARLWLAATKKRGVEAPGPSRAVLAQQGGHGLQPVALFA